MKNNLFNRLDKMRRYENKLTTDEQFISVVNAMKHSIKHYSEEKQKNAMILYIHKVNEYIQYKEELEKIENTRFIKLTECKNKINSKKIYTLITKPFTYSARENILSAEFKDILRVEKKDRVWYCSGNVIEHVIFNDLYEKMNFIYIFMNNEKLGNFMGEMKN